MEAGVFTGVKYSYFKDKKSIFIDVIVLYAQQVSKPMNDALQSLQEEFDLQTVVEGIFDAFEQSHDITKAAHEG